MAIVMTKDGQVRPLQLADSKEVAERDERIVALEKLNATLAAQVDRMRPVVDAALVLASSLRGIADWSVEESALEYAARMYQQAMAQLAKGEVKGNGWIPTR